MQSKSINLNFCHFSLIFGQNTKGYSLTFWPKLAHFHHFSMCNQNQSISMSVISPSIFGQNTKAIALLFGQNRLIFITFQCAIKINQFEFRSFFAHFWAKYQGYSLTCLAKIGSFSSLFNVQSKSINLNFCHFSLIFGQNTKGYSLTFWPKLAHFHHFSMCNQNQSISMSVISRSILGKIPRL